MLYHTGPSSLVFFVGCYKITDSDLQIQNYNNNNNNNLFIHSALFNILGDQKCITTINNLKIIQILEIYKSKRY